jgi:hypothetical protein
VPTKRVVHQRGNIPAFIQALKRGDDYIKRLAEKYGLGICYAKKLAHEVKATLQFRPGLSKPPLSSDFPQRHFDQPAQPEDYVRIVHTVLKKCFNG